MINNTSLKNGSESASYFSNTKGNNHLNPILIINCVLNAPLMLISIFGNTLVLAAILRTPSLRSPSITLLCSLAVSDFLVGAIVQPLYIATEVLRVRVYPALRITEIIQFSLCGVSLCTVTAISFDRFAALHYHMRYAATVTIPRVTRVLVTTWIVVSILSGFYFWNKIIFFAGICFAICVCLLISTYSYTRIFQIVQQHQSQIHVQQQAIQSSGENILNMNMLRLKRSAINSFIFYVFIILCYLPMLVSLSLYAISKKDWTKVWNFADTVVFMNSSINPLLYCWRLGELRTAVVKTGRQVFCRKRQES
ncbi:melanocyte-stimulating hormone receptor-like [Oculina patagonica]